MRGAYLNTSEGRVWVPASAVKWGFGGQGRWGVLVFHAERTVVAVLRRSDNGEPDWETMQHAEFDNGGVAELVNALEVVL